MAESTQGRPASGKLRWFKLAAALLPVFALLLVEGALRVGGYGKPYPLFIEDTTQAGYRIMNPEVSEKYFLDPRNATVGFFEPFPAEREPGSIRLVVLGASTAVGFPYLHNGSFHRMLRYRLQRAFPDRRIEVINLALTGINSYALLDFGRPVIAQQPDAVLIYAGHNEYYGTLGVASNSRLGRRPWLVRTGLWFREWRLGQALLALWHQLTSAADRPPDLRENLMKRLASEQRVPYGSALYREGLEQFQSNMNRLLGRLRQAGVPVLISTLVSNESDQYPLQSGWRAGADTATALGQLEVAREAQEVGRPQEALRALSKALQLDSTHAATHFMRARALEASGRHAAALQAYRAARRHDQLRFRAPLAMNERIRDLAVQHQATVVDMDQVFRRHAPHGILGEELLLEHLHPNLKGYRLMAEAFLAALQTADLLPPATATDPTDTLPYPLTAVDSLYGRYTTLILKQGWPFFEDIELDTSGRSMPEAIAGALAVKQLSWEQAMDRLFRHYQDAGAYRQALTVARAVIFEHPERAELYARAGTLCLRLQDYPSARRFFDRALEREPRPEYAYFGGMARLRLSEVEEALAFLRAWSDHLPSGSRADRLRRALAQVDQLETLLRESPERTDLRYRLAGMYRRMGLNEAAGRHLEEVLRLDPGHGQARQLIQDLMTDQIQ